VTADKFEIAPKLGSFALVFIHLIPLKQHCAAIFHNSTYNNGPNCVYDAVSVRTGTGTGTGSQPQIFHAFSLLPASHISVPQAELSSYANQQHSSTWVDYDIVNITCMHLAKPLCADSEFQFQVPVERSTCHGRQGELAKSAKSEFLRSWPTANYDIYFLWWNPHNLH
jgi:hypothetical protein